jgi:protein O-mannosyl-transferase
MAGATWEMRNTQTLTWVPMSIVIIVIALVYRPVLHAGFVWDDVLDFVQMGWLRYGDAWKHYVFKDFNEWRDYFRPLVVALFTLQVRLFNDTPGPMHATSLVLHLIDTLLVGLLSRRCSEVATHNVKWRITLPVVSMTLYGFHPVLIEPVAWIGCQFDLVATMFMLIALLANDLIQKAALRAMTVAIFFFLAACAKESSAALPLIMTAFDWALSPGGRKGQWRIAMQAFIKRNWLTYTAMSLSGVVYLAFRHWSLGQLINPIATSSSSIFAQMQEVCFIYLHYWKMLFWPMHGMSPIHEFDTHQFNTLSASSLLVDFIATLIFVSGFYFALKRSSPVGCMVMAMTFALLPVLHITSIAFTSSLYHERYVMTSLAVMCAMLPLIRIPSWTEQGRARAVPAIVTAGGCLWLLVAIFDIRTTLPLWSNNLNLWRWALVENPSSPRAMDNLLSAYIENGDYASAHRLINDLLSSRIQCANCMLNAAILSIRENDPARAGQLLEIVKNSKEVTTDKQMFRVYLVTTGQMLVLQGQLSDSDEIFREAIRLGPLDPQPRLALATALAMQGKIKEATEIGESGISLLSPDKRKSAQKDLSRAITSGVRSQ